MKISPRRWSTKAVEEFIKQVSITGSMPRYSPFHKADTSLRAADLDFSYTENEIIEKTKIAANIFYFAQTYCYVMQDDGITKIKNLRNYQKKALVSFIKHLRTVWLASRQIGKTCNKYTKLVTKDSLNSIGNEPMFKLYYENIERKTIYNRFMFFLYRTQYSLRQRIERKAVVV